MYRNERNKVVLFLCLQLPRDKLQSALPLTKIGGSTHLVAHFVNGTDYVGAATERDVQQQIKRFNMQPIEDPNILTEFGTEAVPLVRFARDQLNSLQPAEEQRTCRVL